MINKRIKILREKFKKYQIDGYIIPKNDDLPLIGTSFNSNIDEVISVIEIKNIIENFFK